MENESSTTHQRWWLVLMRLEAVKIRRHVSAVTNRPDPLPEVVVFEIG
jgi:hypothetical protein